MLIQQILGALLSGLSIFPELLFSAFSFRKAINGAQDQIWAAIIGVPVWLIAIASLIVGVVCLLIKLRCCGRGHFFKKSG